MLNPDECNHVQMVDDTAEEERGELVKYRQHRCGRELQHRGSHICVSCKRKFGVPGWTNGGNRDYTFAMLSRQREHGSETRDWGYELVPELSDGTDDIQGTASLDYEMHSHRMRRYADISGG